MSTLAYRVMNRQLHWEVPDTHYFTGQEMVETRKSLASHVQRTLGVNLVMKMTCEINFVVIVIAINL